MSLRRTLGLALGLLALQARGQLTEFCRLTQVRVERLANGVRIRLQADGVLRPEWRMRDYYTFDPQTAQRRRRRQARFTIYLENVLGAPGALVPVNVYPVSHLEFAVPSEARESVGLLCTLVLYKPGTVGRWQAQSSEEERGLDLQWLGEDVAPIQVDVEPSSDARELLIFVTSDRPAEPELLRPAPRPSPARLEVSMQAGRLQVSALNADLQTLLTEVSRLAQTPVYVDDQLQRRVSLEMHDATLPELLAGLQAAYGLTVIPSQGGYFVVNGVPSAAAPYWAAETRALPLHHLSAPDAPHLLPDPLLPYLHPDPQTNRLIVTGPPPLVDKVATDLAALDRPPWQVRVRAWSVQCTGSGEETRAVHWELAGGETGAVLSSEGELALTVSARQARELLARLTALRQRGVVAVRSCPALTLTTGTWAELFAGQRHYYWRLSRRRWQQEVTVGYAEAGAWLRCRPLVASDAGVRLQVEIDDATVRPGQRPPLLSHRCLTTTAWLAPGHTLVAGGLRQWQAVREQQRLGAAGPWPGLAALAPGRQGLRTVTELWILLEAQAQPGPLPSAGGEANP
jgi:hypothetical protein